MRVTRPALKRVSDAPARRRRLSRASRQIGRRLCGCATSSPTPPRRWCGWCRSPSAWSSTRRARRSRCCRCLACASTRWCSTACCRASSPAATSAAGPAFRRARLPAPRSNSPPRRCSAALSARRGHRRTRRSSRVAASSTASAIRRRRFVDAPPLRFADDDGETMLELRLPHAPVARSISSSAATSSSSPSAVGAGSCRCPSRCAAARALGAFCRRRAADPFRTTQGGRHMTLARLEHAGKIYGQKVRTRALSPTTSRSRRRAGAAARPERLGQDHAAQPARRARRAVGGQGHVDGHDLGALGRRGLTLFRRESVGFIFQFFNLVPSLTARENVQVAAELDGVDAAAVDAGWRASGSTASRTASRRS